MDEVKLTVFVLGQFLDKKVTAHMQGGRRATGLLRGYDVFLNIVLDDATEDTNPAQKHELGQIVGSLRKLSMYSLTSVS